jgi:hypothetical protein
MSYKSFFESPATGLQGLPGYSTERKPSEPVAPQTSDVASVASVARSPNHSADDPGHAGAFEERAAIAEHDGGLPRQNAKLLALACTVPLAEHETAESREATVLHFADYLDRCRARSRNRESGK